MRADITGRTFGSLAAIRPTGEIRGGSAVWIFHCAGCGRDVEFTLKSVKWNGRTSCGCLRKLLNQRQAKAMGDQFAKDHIFEGTNISLIIRKRAYTNNQSSGVCGVNWHKASQKWVARIQVKGKQLSIGYFDHLEDAIAARKEAEEKYFAPIIEEYKKSPTDN